MWPEVTKTLERKNAEVVLGRLYKVLFVGFTPVRRFRFRVLTSDHIWCFGRRFAEPGQKLSSGRVGPRNRCALSKSSLHYIPAHHPCLHLPVWQVQLKENGAQRADVCCRCAESSRPTRQIHPKAVKPSLSPRFRLFRTPTMARPHFSSTRSSPCTHGARLRPFFSSVYVLR